MNTITIPSALLAQCEHDLKAHCPDMESNALNQLFGYLNTHGLDGHSHQHALCDIDVGELRRRGFADISHAIDHCACFSQPFDRLYEMWIWIDYPMPSDRVEKTAKRFHCSLKGKVDDEHYALIFEGDDFQNLLRCIDSAVSMGREKLLQLNTFVQFFELSTQCRDQNVADRLITIADTELDSIPFMRHFREQNDLTLADIMACWHQGLLYYHNHQWTALPVG